MAAQGVIQKLFLEVDSNDVTINHHRSDEVMQLIKSEVLPQLEHILESLFEQTNLRLQIDRLDLDLGSCNQQNLAQVLGEQLREQLPVAIKDKLNSSATEDLLEGALEARKSEQIQTSASHTVDARHAPSSQGRLLDITVFFLQTGRLPWWSTAEESLATIIKSWDEEIEAGTGISKLEHLLQVAAVQPKVRKRFVLQFKMPFILKAVSMSPKHERKLAFLHEVSQTFELHKKNKTLRSTSSKKVLFQLPAFLENVWLEGAVEAVLKSNSAEPVDPVKWLTNLLSKTAPEHPAILSEIEQALRSASSQEVQQLLSAIEKAIPQVWESITKHPDNRSEHTTKQHTAQQNPHPTKDKFADEVLENVFAPTQREHDDSIYISNAGLVLLHPFLPHFLQSLGLTENHRFTSENARIKAIYILHYLATGKTTATEDQLYFEKFICAWQEDEPLPDYAIENKEELDVEIDRLWDAIKSRWTAMKASKFDALRVNFLHRDGKLEQDHAGHWTLIVEPDGRDVLLQMIDWSVYVLRLPWMAEVVYVEWSK